MTAVAKLLSFKRGSKRGSYAFIELSHDDALSEDEIKLCKERAELLYREFGAVTVTAFASEQPKSGQALLILTTPSGLNFKRLSRLVDSLLPDLVCTKLSINNPRDPRLRLAMQVLQKIKSREL